jgi:NAD(P)-dependent dehydrogenase (short-subunit alcohol dehydrogenase family)
LHNAKVYVAARSPEKAESAIKSLKDITGKDAIFLQLDLANLKAIKAAAEEFNRLVSCVTPFQFQYLIHVTFFNVRSHSA